MRKSFGLSFGLGCLMLVLAHPSARASAYSIDFSFTDAGEASYVFEGWFDSSKADSGTGTLQVYPEVVGAPPYTDNLSGIDATLSYSQVDGNSVALIGMGNFPFTPDIFPIYFYDAPSGFQFDISDSSFFFNSARLAAVPLPTAAPLFGAALLGLAAVGYGLKRRSLSTAV